MSSLPSHVALANLVFRYAELVDAGDFDGIATLFADGAITATGSDVVDAGAEAVLARYVDWTRRYPDDGTPKTKHVLTNLIFDIDEEAGRAEVRSYFTVLQQTAVLPLQPIIAGRYVDTFERVEGTWRYGTKHIVPQLYGDLSQHLLLPTS